MLAEQKRRLTVIQRSGNVDATKLAADLLTIMEQSVELRRYLVAARRRNRGVEE